MRGGDFKSKLTWPGSSVFLPGRQGRKRTSPEPLSEFTAFHGRRKRALIGVRSSRGNFFPPDSREIRDLN